MRRFLCISMLCLGMPGTKTQGILLLSPGDSLRQECNLKGAITVFREAYYPGL